MKHTQKSLLAVGGILMLVLTALFFLVTVTQLYIIAYSFALLGIAAMVFGGIYVLKNPNSYPWSITVPIATTQYLIAELAFSAIFVALEQFSVFRLSNKLFIFFHIVILAIFAVRVIVLNSGKTHVERLDNKVKNITMDWKLMVADLEALTAQYPAARNVLEAAKYSDPVANPALYELDVQIRNNVAKLSTLAATNDEAAKQLCEDMLLQIKDRNNRVKIMK